jgi:hypothetical protein
MSLDQSIALLCAKGYWSVRHQSLLLQYDLLLEAAAEVDGPRDLFCERIKMPKQ